MPLLPVSDIEKIAPIFKGKVGNSIASFLRRAFSIKTLSDIYDEISVYQGPDFARALLERLGVKYEIRGVNKGLDLPDGPFITVSNHPYGGIDGIILVDMIGHLRPGLRVMVNDFLSLIEPLRPIWIEVNPKNDAQNEVTTKNINGVKEVLKTLNEGNPVGFFPAGAVSNYYPKRKKIEDREWQEPLTRLIQKAKVPVVPIRFFDRNSKFFYSLGLIDWRLRTLRLPRELANKGGDRIRVGVGAPISVEEQLKHPDPAEFNAWIRESVYGMSID